MRSFFLVPLFLVASFIKESIANYRSNEGIIMEGHSLDLPFEFDQRKWIYTQSTEARPQSVILVPNSQNRFGLLRHTDKLNTREFEIEFSFTVNGSQQYDNRNGFAFWYRSDFLDNCAHISQCPKFGQKDISNGFGVFFNPSERGDMVSLKVFKPEKKQSTSYSSEFYDDSTTELKDNIRTMNMNYRNNKNEVFIKIKAGKRGVTIFSKVFDDQTKEYSRWRYLIGDYTPIEEGLYMGFSAYNSLKNPDLVQIYSLKVLNLDPNSIIGQESLEGLGDTMKEKLIQEGKILKNLDALSDDEVLVHLTDFIQTHMEENTTKVEKQKKDIRILNSNILELSDQINDVRSKLKVYFTLSTIGATPQSQSYKNISSEVLELKGIFEKKQTEQNNELSKISDIKIDHDYNDIDISELTHKAILLEKELSERTSKYQLIIIFCIACILSFGIVVWKWLRKVEKLHVI